MMNENRNRAWFYTKILCKDCESDVKVCSSDQPCEDYEYFCINELCKNNIGTHLGDMEDPPEWTKLKKEEI